MKLGFFGWQLTKKSWYLKRAKAVPGGYGHLLLTKLVSYEKKLLYHKSSYVDSIIKYFNLLTTKP